MCIVFKNGNRFDGEDFAVKISGAITNGFLISTVRLDRVQIA